MMCDPHILQIQLMVSFILVGVLAVAVGLWANYFKG